MSQTFSEIPSNDLYRYIQSIVCRSRKTSVYYENSMKALFEIPAMCYSGTEGGNLVVIDMPTNFMCETFTWDFSNSLKSEEAKYRAPSTVIKCKC